MPKEDRQSALRVIGRAVIKLFRVPLLLLLLLSGFILMVDPYFIFGAPSLPRVNVSRPFYEGRATTAKPYQLFRLRPKVVALGASGSEVGLSPNHPGWADRNAFNFSIPGANSYQVMLAFLQAEAVAAPLKQAVVGLDFLAYGIYRKDGPAFRDEIYRLEDLRGFADFLDATLAERPRSAGTTVTAPVAPAAPSVGVVWDEQFYLSIYPDVAAEVAKGTFVSGRDHYERAGKVEGRYNGGLPADWDEAGYLRANPDVAASVAEKRFISGFHHYIAAGRQEKRVGGFLPPEEKFYLSVYPDVAAAVAAGIFTSGRDHYERNGRAEGRFYGNTPADWDEVTYLQAQPDVAVAIAEKRFATGFHHYIAAGRQEGRLGGFPVPGWNEAGYLAANPAARIAIARGLYRSGFAHYAVVGRAGGRVGGLPAGNLLEHFQVKWPALNSWLFTVREVADLTISPTAIGDAFRTIARQSSGPSFSDRGQRIWTDQEAFIRGLGGVGKAYRAWIGESRAWSIFWWDPPERMYCLSQPATGMSTLDTFRYMLRQAHARGTDLRLFVSPMNTSIRWIMDKVDLNGRFEFWLREMVRINEEEAARAGRQPFDLWNFADTNTVTEEPIPPAGDFTTMRWFWEVGHYREITGDSVLDRIFGTRDQSRPLPEDFGVRLTPATIEEHLVRDRAKRLQWAAANPDVAELIDRAARRPWPRVDHQAQANCW